MVLDHEQTRTALMADMTHYVDIGAPKEAVMYYQANGASHIRLPDGTLMHGTWRLNEAGYDVSWSGGPAGSWHFDHQPGVISYVDGNGKNHGPVTRIVPGDAEGLAA